jgi:hypothetical protein
MTIANRHKSASVHEMPESDSLFDDLALRRELSANLVGFCRYLRQNGLRTGMGEQMDALRALEEVDLKHETAFKMALRTTLAKSTQCIHLFSYSGRETIQPKITTESNQICTQFPTQCQVVKQ